jgi:hypothetical protein
VKRSEFELPAATSRWGWRFHHVGIPTDEQREGEKHIPQYGMHVSGFDTSPFGIEWMRFDHDSTVDPVIQRVPHVAFVVDDLDSEIEGRELIGGVSSPMEGIRVAMFLDDGIPVELLEFERKDEERS